MILKILTVFTLALASFACSSSGSGTGGTPSAGPKTPALDQENEAVDGPFVPCNPSPADAASLASRITAASEVELSSLACVVGIPLSQDNLPGGMGGPSAHNVEIQLGFLIQNHLAVRALMSAVQLDDPSGQPRVITQGASPISFDPRAGTLVQGADDSCALAPSVKSAIQARAVAELSSMGYTIAASDLPFCQSGSLSDGTGIAVLRGYVISGESNGISEMDELVSAIQFDPASGAVLDASTIWSSADFPEGWPFDGI